MLRLFSEADRFEAETESLTDRALKLLSLADMEATTVLNEASADKLADVSAERLAEVLADCSAEAAADSLADSCAEASVCDWALSDSRDSLALCEKALMLASSAEVAEVDAIPETDRSLTLASEAEIWLIRLVVEVDKVLRLLKDVEYSDNEAVDKDSAAPLSQVFRSLKLWSAVDREALAVATLSAADVAALVEAVATDSAAVCEVARLVAADVDAEAALAATDAVLSLATDHCDWVEYSLADCSLRLVRASETLSLL